MKMRCLCPRFDTQLSTDRKYRLYGMLDVRKFELESVLIYQTVLILKNCPFDILYQNQISAPSQL